MRLIVTRGTDRKESEIKTQAQWHAALKTHFGVVL